ncbi:MAG: amino acid racemase [Lachnospiraceae bacterium]|nr:amino acid racemase [Lachnospiraceae bacterium]
MSRYKTIGIIGGMGPLATCDMYRKIILHTRADKDSEHLHIIIDSNSDIPDRTKAILYHGKSPVKYLKKSAQRLEQCGAELIIIACNTSHYFLDKVRSSVKVPILSMIDVTLSAAKRKGITKAALFATEGTVKSGIYTTEFERNGIELLLPDDIQQGIITDAIYRCIKAGKDGNDSQDIQRLVNRFEAEGAQAVILGCTELPIFMQTQDIAGEFIDPSLELAKAVILAAGAELKEERNFMMNDIISVKGLKKKYGNFQAVKGIDFSVKKGQLFAFLGPNGAGKSTTINMLCTLLSPSEGEVTINGYDLKKKPEKIRDSIGVVFQDSLLDSVLTVRENLRVRAGFYYSDKTQINEAIEKAAKAADIIDFIDRPYGKLSGGQRRRADIARALLNTPKILFLDEPTTGLDPQTRKNVWETVLKLQRENDMTIFLTTHYMEESRDADEVVIIDGGQIAVQGTPLELKEKYSAEILKMSTNDDEKMEELLNELDADFEKNGQAYFVKLKNTKEAIPILNKVNDVLETFEVLHGTMDDVFLNVTGKEIRE